MFKYEFDAITRDFKYDEYVQFLLVVNPEAEPVRKLTYFYLMQAFEREMNYEMTKE
jgi:hypothetical protein